MYNFRYEDWLCNTSRGIDLTMGQWLWHQWPALLLSSLRTFVLKIVDEKFAKRFTEKVGIKRKIKVYFTFD